jgi:DNA repair protein RadC
MNLSMLDRAQLEAILLDPSNAGGHSHRCCDADPEPMTEEATRDRRLRHVLAAAHELLVRIAHQSIVGRQYLNTPSLSKDYLVVLFAGAEQEMFVVVFLDVHLRVIAAETMFKGTLTQTSVYPREIVRQALRHNAASVVLAHNHPSGHAEPSRADEFLTNTIKSALALVDVRVIDHIVVGGGNTISFAERGLV